MSRGKLIGTLNYTPISKGHKPELEFGTMAEEEHTFKERWDKAIERAKEILKHYEAIPEGAFGAMMIKRDIDLYEAGDHSEALLEVVEGMK